MVALEDKDWQVRANAIWALTVEENFNRLEVPLFVALQDNHPKVREYAAKALGKLAGERWLENPDAVETLIARLNDEHLSVRAETAKALGAIKHPRAVEPLIAALKAPSAEDLLAAQKVDNEYNRGREAVLARQKRYPRIKFQREGGHSGDFISYLHTLDDTIIGTSLFDDLRNEINMMGFRDGKVNLQKATIRDALDAFAREKKCRWIARVRADGKVVISFKDGDMNEYSVVRGSAAEALGEIGNPHAVEPLIIALKGKDPHVRRQAAAALGEINDPRVVEPLIATLKDEFWWVRATAVRQLGETNDPRSFNPLIAALNDEQPNVRARAAEALASLADYRAVEALIAALKDKNAYVRWHVAKALKDLNDSRAVEPLIAALKDKDELVRRSAMSALAKLKDYRAVAPLIALLKDEDDFRRMQVREALEAITGMKLGESPEKWRQWWKENKETVLNGR